jgi:hypothetical protein
MLTKQVLEVDKLDVVADRGYFSNEQILKCADADITVTLPKPQTSNNKLKGSSSKPTFDTSLIMIVMSARQVSCWCSSRARRTKI